MKVRLVLLTVFLLGSIVLPVSAGPPVFKMHYTTTYNSAYNDCDGWVTQETRITGHAVFKSDIDPASGRYHHLHHSSYKIVYASGVSGHFVNQVVYHFQDVTQSQDHYIYTSVNNGTLVCTDGRAIQTHMTCHFTLIKGEMVNYNCPF